MAGVDIITLTTGVGAVMSVAIAIYSAFQTVKKLVAKHFISATAYLVRLALSSVIAYTFIRLTIGAFL